MDFDRHADVDSLWGAEICSLGNGDDLRGQTRLIMGVFDNDTTVCTLRQRKNTGSNYYGIGYAGARALPSILRIGVGNQKGGPNRNESFSGTIWYFGFWGWALDNPDPVGGDYQVLLNDLYVHLYPSFAPGAEVAQLCGVPSLESVLAARPSLLPVLVGESSSVPVLEGKSELVPVLDADPSATPVIGGKPATEKC